MGWQEAGGVCWQMVDMGLNASPREHEGPPLSTGRRYSLPSFGLRVAPHWSSLCTWIWVHTRLSSSLRRGGGNVGRLSVCVFETRSGPVCPWARVGGSGDHRQARPRWVFSVGSPMELSLWLPTQLSQLDGGSRRVGGGTVSRLCWWQLPCLVGGLGW